MNEANAIEVRDLKKSFKIYYDKSNTLRDKVVSKGRNKYELHQVLKGISFDIQKGEAVGLVGYNGCGKSTTLKLLTRIMYPDSGTVEICGRVSSLLELGAGFHQDLSGRENIYINASIFGLDKKEIDRRIDDIIEFSELGEYIDNPVRTYSSGMYMRLAFSVAINVDADVLLIDEILAVGDVNFQTKCFNKLMEIKGSGTTIVFVSHATGQVERICDRSIWIKDGEIECQGNPVDVHREYLNYMTEMRNEAELSEEERRIAKKKAEDEAKAKAEAEAKKNAEELEKLRALDPIVLNDISLCDSEGNRKKIFQLHDAITVNIDATANVDVEEYYIEVNVVRADGLFVYGCDSRVDNVPCEKWNGKKIIKIEFDKMELLPGLYHFDVHFGKNTGGTIYFGGSVANFEIENNVLEHGCLYLDHSWSL